MRQRAVYWSFALPAEPLLRRLSLRVVVVVAPVWQYGGNIDDGPPRFRCDDDGDDVGDYYCCYFCYRWSSPLPSASRRLRILFSRWPIFVFGLFLSPRRLKSKLSSSPKIQ